MTRPRFSRQRRERLALWVGAVAGAVVIGALLVLSVTVQNGLPGNKGAELEIEFADVGNVQRYDDVRVAGRRVGGVASIRYEDGHAVVLVRVDDGLEGLHESTRANIRLSGLIGAQYVELVPGGKGPPLKSGARIPMSRTRTSPDVFAMLRAFDSKDRVRDLRSLIQGLGGGMAGRGEDGNATLRTAPRLLHQSDLLLETVGRERHALQRLFPASASFAAALEPVAPEMAAGFRQAVRAMRPLARHPDEVAALLSEMAAAVHEVRVDVPRTYPMLRETERLTRTVTRLTRNAPHSLERATAVLRASPGPLRSTVPVLRRARTAVPAATLLLQDVMPLIAPFRRSLESSLPQIREIARRVCDLDAGLKWMRSVVAFGTRADHELGWNNLIRIWSGGPGTTTENVSPENREGRAQHQVDQDPPPCQAADQRYPP